MDPSPAAGQRVHLAAITWVTRYPNRAVRSLPATSWSHAVGAPAVTLSAMRTRSLLSSSPSRRRQRPSPSRRSRSGPARSTTRRSRRSKQVVGHEPGEEITHARAGGRPTCGRSPQAAPDRTRLVEYARTWEGRPLWLFVVGSRRAHRRSSTRSRPTSSASPTRADSAAADADRLVATLPVVVWLVHAVHGNEISSSRRGAARGLSPAGRARRRRRRRRAARRARAHRPDAEPRRPRALRLPEPAGPRRRCPTRRPTTPSTTSRGRAAARITTCST